MKPQESRTLLAHPDALKLARPVAEELAELVLQHAKLVGITTLAEVIRDSICEHMVYNALESRATLLTQPISRAGHIAIRGILDATCSAFEALLTAEVSR